MSLLNTSKGRISRSFLALLCSGWLVGFTPDHLSICHGQTAKNASKPAVSRIYGRIQYVDAFPDYKVEVVTAFEDLGVQEVDAFPDGPGKWQIVTEFPDYKIQKVSAFGDFKIRYVKAFPGAR